MVIPQYSPEVFSKVMEQVENFEEYSSEREESVEETVQAVGNQDELRIGMAYDYAANNTEKIAADGEFNYDKK